MNLLINDTYDLICLILGVIGTILCVYLLYLHSWNLDELLFGAKSRHTLESDKTDLDTH